MCLADDPICPIVILSHVNIELLVGRFDSHIGEHEKCTILCIVSITRIFDFDATGTDVTHHDVNEVLVEAVLLHKGLVMTLEEFLVEVYEGRRGILEIFVSLRCIFLDFGEAVVKNSPA